MSVRRIAKWEGQTLAQLRRRWKRPSVHIFGRVDSTNQVAKRLAEEGEPVGTIVVAREQSAGRGRGAKVWHSPPKAGVYISMIFSPSTVDNPTLLQVLAGLGIVRELRDGFPGLAAALKWPNDIYAGEGKLGGILAETSWSDGSPRFLVVGVGVNARPLPESVSAAVRSSATSIEAELGQPVDPLAVADAIVSGLETYLADPPSALDAAALELLDEFDWLRDRRIKLAADGADAPVPGVAVGIAPDGALLFRPDRGALRRVQNAVVTPEKTSPRKTARGKKA